MSKKTYNIIRSALAAAVAIGAAISVVIGNAIIPLVMVLVAIGILYLVKRQVKEVLVDERNYRVSEKAARLTIGIFGPVIAILSMVLIALGRSNYPGLEQTGYTLGYSAAALVVLYDVFYYYFERKI